MSPPARLPFRLRVSGEDAVRDFEALSTSYHFSGTLALEGEALTLTWRGEARVQEVSLLSVRDDRLPLPQEQLVIPLAELEGLALAGGWWRPRLELRGRDPGLLAIVPGEAHGMVRLWIARRDRTRARAVLAAADEARQRNAHGG